MAEVEAPLFLEENAYAKVNLALHVTGIRANGYHELESLVAFPKIGDRLLLKASSHFNLTIDGPFSSDLKDNSLQENLVYKAAAKVSEYLQKPLPPVQIQLTKNLPVASGIGGGSSDAAATMRLLLAYFSEQNEQTSMHKLALELGADVPVCLRSEPKVMSGIGEKLSNTPQFPTCGIVLVNPKVSVSTASVFKGLKSRTNASLPLLPESFGSIDELIHYLHSCRNDLEPPALQVCPNIQDVLNTLEADERVKLARMSGSGATCFALCAIDEMNALAKDLEKNNPNWWVAAASLD